MAQGLANPGWHKGGTRVGNSGWHKGSTRVPAQEGTRGKNTSSREPGFLQSAIYVIMYLIARVP